MGYKLITAPETEQDIDQAVLWYVNTHKQTAKRFITELRDVQKYITNNPNKIAIKYNNIRVAFLKKFSYGLHYIFKNNTITIVALFHTSENPQKWSKR
jgi:plasmid stabilization system protein ParE